jgi:hypothetical protein
MFLSSYSFSLDVMLFLAKLKREKVLKNHHFRSNLLNKISYLYYNEKHREARRVSRYYIRRAVTCVSNAFFVIMQTIIL